MARKEYENMTDKEKARYDRAVAKNEAYINAGKGMTSLGGKMMGCGCLLTLLVTIPIILIVIFFL